MGVNAGAHALLPEKRNNVEVGVDFMMNNQQFSYADEVNNYFGERKITTSQFILSLTYNIKMNCK